MILTVRRLKELLLYDPKTGAFTWRVYRGRNAKRGTAAGVAFDGYIRIKVDGKNYLAHRLAWFYVHGRWPKERTDHKNLNKSDNRISNLREANSTQNRANSKGRKNRLGPLKGAYQIPSGRWVACIRVNKTNHYLGLFLTAKKANEVYKIAAKKYFGEFARSA